MRVNRSFSVAYLSWSVSNATWNWLMPSSVSISLFTRMRTGSRMNLSDSECSSGGIVALNKHTCTFVFSCWKIL